MKFKYLLILLMSFMFSCSPSPVDFDLNWDGIDFSFPEGTFGYVNISKDCDCLDQEYYWNCLDSYWLFEEEFNRIIEMINQSNGPCNYVQGTDVYDKTFEGYVMNYYPN